MTRLPLLPLVFLTLLTLLVGRVECGLKRGLAWGADNRFAAHDFGPLLTWYMHWADAPVPQLDQHGLDFVPMLWGPQKLEQWKQRKAEFAKNRPQHVLAFNEPDCEGQANMSPEDAAKLWRSELQPLAAQGVKVSTPQICWKVDWLRSFKAACSDCDVGFIAAHWYGGYQDFAKLQKYIADVSDVYPGLEVWITEMGLTSKSGASQQDVSAFLQKAVAWMQTSARVERVAWTGCFAIDNPPDGFLSSLGAYFNADGSVRALLKWMANDQFPEGWTSAQWLEITDGQGSSATADQSNERTAVASSSSSKGQKDKDGGQHKGKHKGKGKSTSRKGKRDEHRVRGKASKRRQHRRAAHRAHH